MHEQPTTTTTLQMILTSCFSPSGCATIPGSEPRRQEPSTMRPAVTESMKSSPEGLQVDIPPHVNDHLEGGDDSTELSCPVLPVRGGGVLGSHSHHHACQVKITVEKNDPCSTLAKSLSKENSVEPNGTGSYTASTSMSESESEPDTDGDDSKEGRRRRQRTDSNSCESEATNTGSSESGLGSGVESDTRESDSDISHSLSSGSESGTMMSTIESLIFEPKEFDPEIIKIDVHSLRQRKSVSTTNLDSQENWPKTSSPAGPFNRSLQSSTPKAATVRTRFEAIRAQRKFSLSSTESTSAVPNKPVPEPSPKVRSQPPPPSPKVAPLTVRQPPKTPTVAMSPRKEFFQPPTPTSNSNANRSIPSSPVVTKECNSLPPTPIPHAKAKADVDMQSENPTRLAREIARALVSPPPPPSKPVSSTNKRPSTAPATPTGTKDQLDGPGSPQRVRASRRESLARQILRRRASLSDVPVRGIDP